MPADDVRSRYRSRPEQPTTPRPGRLSTGSRCCEYFDRAGWTSRTSAVVRRLLLPRRLRVLTGDHFGLGRLALFLFPRRRSGIPHVARRKRAHSPPPSGASREATSALGHARLSDPADRRTPATSRQTSAEGVDVDVLDTRTGIRPCGFRARQVHLRPAPLYGALRMMLKPATSFRASSTFSYSPMDGRQPHRRPRCLKGRRGTM